MEWEMIPAKNPASFLMLASGIQVKERGEKKEEREIKQPPLHIDCITREALNLARHNSCLLRGSIPRDFVWDGFMHLSLTPASA